MRDLFRRGRRNTHTCGYEVMANEQAVYFIHGCQELRDQVQRMIVEDGLYTAIYYFYAPRKPDLALRLVLLYPKLKKP